MEEGEEEILDPAFSRRPSACSLSLVYTAGGNSDLQKWSEVPFWAAFLLKEFSRDKGEGFQL